MWAVIPHATKLFSYRHFVMESVPDPYLKMLMTKTWISISHFGMESVPDPYLLNDTGEYFSILDLHC